MIAAITGRNGFIVAAIYHPSDSSRSPGRDHKAPLEALTDRPADITHLIDFMLGAWPDCGDPYDRPFLELALAGRAEALVTGDKDLLALVETFTVRILIRASPGIGRDILA